MPEPRDGEKQSDFIGRCVKQVVGEGKEQKAALGECYGIWRQHHGGTAKSFWESMLGVFKQPTMQGVHAQTTLNNPTTMNEANDRRQLDFNEALVDLQMTNERLGESDDSEEEDEDEEKGEHEDDTEQEEMGEGDSGIVHSVSPTDKRWSTPLHVKKTDPDRRLVFGWASVVEKDGRAVIDKQGDIIPVDELENAAYEYVLHSRDGGDLHERRGVSRLVASLVTTADVTKAFSEVFKEEPAQVGWIVGFKIDDDELWQAYKRGERPELSIGGAAVPVNFELEEDTLKRRGGKRLPRAPFRYDGRD